MISNLNGITTPDELLQAYTALFLFLGGSISLSPEESSLPHVCDSGLLRNLPVNSSNSEYEKASRLLRSPCEHKSTCRVTVSSNYNALLSEEKSSTAFPEASRWLRNGMDQPEYRQRLELLYSRYGYRREKGCNLQSDHLGIELLFINLMIEKYLTEDDYEIKAMIRKDLLAFISDEMLVWLPGWADSVSEKSVTKCYTGISGLIIGSLEDVKEILRNQKLGL
ncbi:MAG: molecular chaperone TorD family protein [Bacteroidales bacterium]|jgi:TorA maturation chaperone TorD|nr:molecular chaperone TorD family protein [Bacteroidales bacterium]